MPAPRATPLEALLPAIPPEADAHPGRKLPRSSRARLQSPSQRVVGIELHSLEPPVEGRPSILSDGVVLLQYMPKCVYVKMEGSDELFLQAAPGTSGSASQPAGPDLH